MALGEAPVVLGTGGGCSLGRWLSRFDVLTVKAVVSSFRQPWSELGSRPDSG